MGIQINGNTDTVTSTSAGGSVKVTPLAASTGLNVGTGASISSPATNVLTLGTNNTEVIRITSGSDVGIGTNSPSSARLHVFGGGGLTVERQTGSTIAYFKNTGTTTPNIAFQASGTTYTPYIGVNNDDLLFGTGSSGSERARITGVGSFGIGTNDPQVRLDVRQDSSSTTTMAGIRVQNTNITDNSQSGISFFNYDNFGAKIYSPRTGSAQGVLIFATNNGNGIAESNVVERARIDSSGNLGVGTNNPGYKLEVAGTASLGTSGLYGYKIQYIGPISNGSTFTLPSGRWQGELHYTWGNNSGRAAKRIVAFSKAPGASGDGYSSTWLDVNSGGSGVLAYSFNQSTGVFTWSVSDGSTSAGYAWILYHPGN